MKKIYEAPSAELYSLHVQEELLTGPTISNAGYGWDDNGPVEPVS